MPDVMIVKHFFSLAIWSFRPEGDTASSNNMSDKQSRALSDIAVAESSEEAIQPCKFPFSFASEMTGSAWCVLSATARMDGSTAQLTCSCDTPSKLSI
jgi:hypothetical protein